DLILRKASSSSFCLASMAFLISLSICCLRLILFYDYIKFRLKIKDPYFLCKTTAVTRLSVNINKIATLRNARGANNPDVIQVARDCERFGAQGITVHPRPDERHIRFADTLALKYVVSTEYNIEGYPDERYLDIIDKVRPTQATLVPDAPDAITSN